MPRVLWGRATSSNVMKVVWLLEECELAYERRDVGGGFGGTDTAEYREMNPTGLVPTLHEDGFSLWESNAILRYLCNAEPRAAAFYGQEPRARADIDRWLDCQQTQLNRPQSVVFLAMVRTPPEQRDQASLRQAVAEAGRAWALLEAPLARHPFVAGEAPTIADMAWGVHVHRWFTMEVERPDTPHLRAWYDRLLQRPAYARHVARPLV